MKTIVVSLSILLLSIPTIGQDLDYATYSRVVDAFLESESINKDIVIVAEIEKRFEVIKDIKHDSPFKDLTVDSVTITQDKSSFKDKFKLKKIKATVVSDSVIEDLLWDDNGDLYYEPFYKRYPGTSGFVTLSRIFYTKDKSKGVLYIAINQDSLAGAGYFIYFDLKDKKLIVKKKMIWVA